MIDFLLTAAEDTPTAGSMLIGSYDVTVTFTFSYLALLMVESSPIHTQTEHQVTFDLKILNSCESFEFTTP